MARTRRYYDWLLQKLADPAEALGYIGATLREYPEGLPKALRNVAEARALAGESGVNSEPLAETEEFKAALLALTAALRGLGMRLIVVQDDPADYREDADEVESVEARAA